MARPIAVQLTAIVFAVAFCLCGGNGGAPPAAFAAEDEPAMIPSEQFQPRIAEGFPEWYIERLKQREQKIVDDLGDDRNSSIVPAALVILKTDEWTPATKITVAFNGGNPRLHALIERIASEWSQYGNIQFDFGRDASGHYRSWSTKDLDYAADVRVGFQEKGFWSAIGKDSINPDLNQPGTQTMNFEGFDRSLPYEFAGHIRHEFGHALGLEHEHQSPLVACDFRWNDDAGYVKTADQFGQFVVDKQGRHPGIYTVFGGPPNNWSKAQTDFNLRQLTSLKDTPVSAYGIGGFDKLSIMKYYYDESLFLSGKNSQCYSPGVNYDFSAEDEKRIALYYPKDPSVAAARMEEKRDAITAVLSQVPQSSLLAKQLQVKRQKFQ